MKHARIQEGILINTLFNYKKNLSEKEKARNHLYDNIDQDEELEFTDADLKPIEPIGL
mgnify:CR=1 FL=1